MTKDPFQLLRKAKLAVREKDVEKAWQLLHEYIIEKPDDIDAWLMLGGLSKPDNRMAYLQRAEELAPDDPRVRKALIWARGQASPVEEEDFDRLNQNPVQPPGKIAAPEPEMDPTELSKPSPTQSTAGEPEPRPSFVPVVPPQEEPTLQSFRSEVYGPEGETEKAKAKPFKWLQRLFTVLFLAIILLLLGIGIYAMITGTEPNVFGYRMMTVTSGSMEPTFMTGSVIIVNTNTGQDYDVGDVAMFWTPEDPDRNITHRIIAISEQDGQRYYQTQGDNNNAPDQELITHEQIRGKYANITVPYLGYFFSFIKSRDGILLLAVLLGLYLVITQAFRIRKLKQEDAESEEPAVEEE